MSSRHNAPVPVLKPAYGPTLPALLAPRSLPARIAAALLAVVILAAAVAIALTTRDDATAVLIRRPVTFNLVYGHQWSRTTQPGAIVSLRHAQGSLFLDSYVVRDLTLPPYRGAVGGMLPVYATRYARSLARRYAEYEALGEGRARINNAIGYELTFRARIGTRRLYEIGERYITGRARPADPTLLQDLCSDIRDGALCGHEISATNPLLTGMRYFSEEFEAHILHGVCPAGTCRPLPPVTSPIAQPHPPATRSSPVPHA